MQIEIELDDLLDISADIVALSVGHFAVAYPSESDGSHMIYAELFDGHGHSCDTPVAISAGTTAVQTNPRVFYAMNAEDYDLFVVTYEREADETVGVYGQIVAVLIEDEHCGEDEHTLELIGEEFMVAETDAQGRSGRRPAHDWRRLRLCGWLSYEC